MTNEKMENENFEEKTEKVFTKEQLKFMVNEMDDYIEKLPPHAKDRALNQRDYQSILQLIHHILEL